MTHIMNSKTFFKSLKETLIACFFDVGGLLAGFLVAFHLGVFDGIPWALAVYPTIVSAKGVIGGLLSGRLSTALHIGTIYPKVFKNTKVFYNLLSSIIVITFIISVLMSCLSVIFGVFFWGISLANFSEIIIVVVATMTLGLIISLITVNVAFLTFKRGLDPDVVVYPIMSTVADIIITIFYVLTLNLFFLFGSLGKYFVVFVGFVGVFLVFYTLPRNIHMEEFVKTIKESFLTLMLVAFIVNVTGTILRRISILVEGRREIYTVYPALIDLTGDVGSIVGSTATTKLALGLLKPSFSAMRNHTTNIFSAWTASVIMYTFLSALSLLINGMFASEVFLAFTSLLLIANVIAVTAMTLISYAIAILTFSKGLDPDNFVIPIESSLADSLTTIALLIALFLVGSFWG